jgi:(+)-trans-carveol dehydrogenase
MGRVDGKVAFITGAARGQGRSHAVRLAREGADIIAVDLGHDLDTIPYPLASKADLEETVALVEAEDRRVLAIESDVRDQSSLDAAVSAGLAEYDHIDIVSANAGVFSFAPVHEMPEAQWGELLDVNLSGVWRTVKAVVPSMIQAGRGGSLILTSSTAGAKGFPNFAHYTASKHGVIGLMRSLVQELSQHGIRVNCVLPTSARTPQVMNDAVYKLFRPDLDRPELEDTLDLFQAINALPVDLIESSDVSNAVLWLASDEARYVTGVALPVDAGALTK